MKSFLKKTASLALAACMTAGLLAGCGSSAKIDGTQTLLTVNGESVDLGVGSFYAKYEQAQLYKYWGAYFGQNGGMFDTIADSSTMETYGESMKDSVIEDLKKMLVIRQHAEEYDVALSDDQTKAIEEAAQAYIDGNDSKVRDSIGASKEDVIELMSLQTIQSLMMDPIVADVDTDIPDEDVQQTSVTYVAVNIAEDDSTESTDTANDSADPAADAEAMAQAVLDAVKAETDIANADISTIASGISEDLSAQTGSFTTNNPEDTTLDDAIVEAVKGLSDGTLVDELVISDDGETYYVVRLDKNFDEALTDSERNTEIIQRKQDKYDEVTDGWALEAETTLNEEAWKTVVLTDSDPITLKDPENSAAESSEG